MRHIRFRCKAFVDMQTKSLPDISLRKSIYFRFAQTRYNMNSRCVCNISSLQDISRIRQNSYRCIAMQCNDLHKVKTRESFCHFFYLNFLQYCVHSLSVHSVHLSAILLFSQKRSGYVNTQTSHTSHIMNENITSDQE